MSAIRGLAAFMLLTTISARAASLQTVRVLVAAENESVLSAQMAGRIVGINARLGDRIGRGQVILHFDCGERQARLGMARAELDGARDLLDAKTKLQAMQSASLLEVGQAEADVAKCRAQIRLYQAETSMCDIMAPFSGRITRLLVKPFESVTMGQPLVELMSDDRLKIQANIPSSWLAATKANEPVLVHIDETGKNYEARISRINGKVDAVSQTVEIEGIFTGRTGDLLPGMSGIATFPGKHQE